PVGDRAAREFRVAPWRLVRRRLVDEMHDVELGIRPIGILSGSAAASSFALAPSMRVAAAGGALDNCAAADLSRASLRASSNLVATASICVAMRLAYWICFSRQSTSFMLFG